MIRRVCLLWSLAPVALALGCTASPATQEKVGTANEDLGESFVSCTTGTGWTASTGQLMIDASTNLSGVIILSAGNPALPIIQVNGHTCETTLGVAIPATAVKAVTIKGKPAGGDTIILDFSHGIPASPLLATTTIVSGVAATGILVNGQVTHAGGGAPDSIVLKGSASADIVTVGQSPAYGVGTNEVLDISLAMTNAVNVILENLADTAVASPNNAPSMFFTLGAGNDTFSAMGWSPATVPVTFSVTVFGGPGNDILTGGLGNDVLNGGPGNDTFVSATAGGDGADQINGGVPGATTDVDVVDYSGRGTSAPVFSLNLTAGGTCTVAPTGVTFTGGGCTTKATASVTLPTNPGPVVATLTNAGGGCTSAPTVAFTAGTCSVTPTATATVKSSTSGIYADINSTMASVWGADLFASQAWLTGYSALVAAPIDGKTLILDPTGQATAAAATVTFAAAANCTPSTPLTCAVTPAAIVAQINAQLTAAFSAGTYAKLVGSRLVLESTATAVATFPYGYVDITGGTGKAMLGLSDTNTLAVGTGLPIGTGPTAVANDGELGEGDDIQNVNTIKGSSVSTVSSLTVTAGTCSAAPTVAFSGGCGTSPTATATLPSGVLTLTLGSGGAGCSLAPTVSFSGGTCTVAPAATASLTATPYGNVLDGSAWSNTLIGGPGNDVLAGGPPAGTYTTAYCATNDADKLQGGNGNDWYDMGLVPACNPVIVAGTGVNLVDFSKRAVALTINLNGTASSGDPTTHPSAQEAVTIPTSMAIVLGGSAADTISVPSSVLTSTYLFGGDEGVGNPGDTITGGGGDDFIWGGTGNDTMNGGPGNDMFFERSTFQVTGASAAGDPDPLQTVAGGSWDGIGSVIYGVLDQPGSGADLVNGGSGTLDRVDLSDTTAPITVTLCADASTVVSLTTGSAWLLGCGNLTAGSNGAVYGADDNDGITAGNNYANIKWVSGGTGVVSTLSNVIIGTAADEILEGGLGLDVILGQGGNDTIYGSATGGTDPTSIDILCGGDDEDQIFGGGAAQIEGEGQMRTATGASTNVLASKAGLGGVQDPENCFGLQDTYSTDPGAGADVCLGAETVLTIGQYYDCANKTCIASVE